MKNDFFIDIAGDVILTKSVDDYLHRLAKRFSLKPELLQSYVFWHLRKFFGESFSVINFEGTYFDEPEPATNSPAIASPASLEIASPKPAEKKPYSSSGKAIYFSMGELGIRNIFVENSNINAVSFANNHSLDFGREVLNKTLSLLEKSGVYTFGASTSDKEIFLPRIVTYNDRKIALIGLSTIVSPDEEDAPVDLHGIAATSAKSAGGVENHKKILKKAVSEAKKAEADIIVVYYHWGTEGANFPNNYQQELGRYAADLGADLVIGTHQHSLQGIEEYHSKKRGKMIPIAYGLGNLLFARSSYPIPGKSIVFRARFSKSRCESVDPASSLGTSSLGMKSRCESVDPASSDQKPSPRHSGLELLGYEVLPVSTSGQTDITRWTPPKSLSEILQMNGIFQPQILNDKLGLSVLESVLKFSDKFDKGRPLILKRQVEKWRFLFEKEEEEKSIRAIAESVLQDDLVDKNLVMKTRLNSPDQSLYIKGNDTELQKRVGSFENSDGIFVGIGSAWRVFTQALCMKKCEGILSLDHNPIHTEVVLPLFLSALRRVEWGGGLSEGGGGGLSEGGGGGGLPLVSQRGESGGCDSYFNALADYMCIFIEKLRDDVFAKYPNFHASVSKFKLFKSRYGVSGLREEILSSFKDCSNMFGDKFILSSREKVSKILKMADNGLVMSATLDFCDPDLNKKASEILKRMRSSKVGAIDISNSVFKNLKDCSVFEKSIVLYSTRRKGEASSFEDFAKGK